MIQAFVVEMQTIPAFVPVDAAAAAAPPPLIQWPEHLDSETHEMINRDQATHNNEIDVLTKLYQTCPSGMKTSIKRETNGKWTSTRHKPEKRMENEK